MKRLVFALAILATPAQAEPMKTIAEFLADKRIDNPSTMKFVAMRCAAAELRFLNKALEIQEKIAPGSTKGDAMLYNMKAMIDLYETRGVDSLARTGNVSDDPIIRADTAWCAGVIAP
jgi:hypothetical protein